MSDEERKSQYKRGVGDGILIGVMLTMAILTIGKYCDLT